MSHSGPNEPMDQADESREPADVVLLGGRVRVRMLMLADEDANEGVDYHLDHLNGLHQIVRSQDDVVCARVQRGLESGAYRPGPYNPSYEFQNQNFVRLYRQVMA